MKKKPPFNENAAIRGAIRRVFARSPLVREVISEGRREVPKYNKDGTRSKKDAVQIHCQVCNSWVSTTKIAVDHIEPVISTTDGFVDWNTFVARLWCDKSNLQRICDDCHQAKTNKERWERILKQDTQLLERMEKLFLSSDDQDKMEFEEGMKKLNKKKKLETYPNDIVERIKKMIPQKSKGKKAK